MTGRRASAPRCRWRQVHGREGFISRAGAVDNPRVGCCTIRHAPHHGVNVYASQVLASIVSTSDSLNLEQAEFEYRRQLKWVKTHAQAAHASLQAVTQLITPFHCLLQPDKGQKQQQQRMAHCWKMTFLMTSCVRPCPRTSLACSWRISRRWQLGHARALRHSMAAARQHTSR